MATLLLQLHSQTLTLTLIRISPIPNPQQQCFTNLNPLRRHLPPPLSSPSPSTKTTPASPPQRKLDFVSSVAIPSVSFSDEYSPVSVSATSRCFTRLTYWL
ncbi:unnamed protein product [Lathyrus oleraceus]